MMIMKMVYEAERSMADEHKTRCNRARKREREAQKRIVLLGNNSQPTTTQLGYKVSLYTNLGQLPFSIFI